jgi:hypothetical protein
MFSKLLMEHSMSNPKAMEQYNINLHKDVEFNQHVDTVTWTIYRDNPRYIQLFDKFNDGTLTTDDKLEMDGIINEVHKSTLQTCTEKWLERNQNIESSIHFTLISQAFEDYNAINSASDSEFHTNDEVKALKEVYKSAEHNLIEHITSSHPTPLKEQHIEWIQEHMVKLMDGCYITE